MSGMADFQIPKRLVVDSETLTPTYGRFVAEPFERGFGTTIGNSIRRVLLSSIPGTAITSIKIEGISHEFSAIPGVKEDVTDLILNIKNLRLKLHSASSKKIRVTKRGPGEVTGKDFSVDPDVEVYSPDLHIATLDKEGRFDMEMTVKTGRGYVPSERNKEDGAPIGVIPIDAIFSPIRRVNCTVELARVGRVTNYDRLILEVWTDGGILPEEAVRTAAGTLGAHLALFSEEGSGETAEEIEAMKVPVVDNSPFGQEVTVLSLSARAMTCLKSAEIKTVGDLVQKTESEIMLTKNFGSKSLDEIKEALHQMGLTLGMKIKGSA